ncbi:MAG: KH domain-containing protein, partial [Sweet potato little leaf phytoplasma]|nr:KH domain-containing protein [Sweet potato little leaf phytoplasma]
MYQEVRSSNYPLHEARKDIEQILNKKIYLDLWVKVEKKWRNNINSLRKIG